MSITSRQKAILHVAKAKLGLTENQYRSCLVHIAGVESSIDLDQPGFEAVLGFFEWRGFTPLVAHGPSYGVRPGMASFAQLELVRALWREWTSGEGSEDGLNTWILRTFKVSSLRFLTKEHGRKAITALKAMKAHKKAA